MTQLEQVKLMNESMILYLRKIGKNSKRNEIISEILSDEACFFKMDKNDAYIILEDIGISKDKIGITYSKLISNDYYYYLQNNGKIQEEDKEIIIRPQKYDYNDLFKKQKDKVKDKNENIVPTIENKENIIRKIINRFKKFLNRKIQATFYYCFKQEFKV